MKRLPKLVASGGRGFLSQCLALPCLTVLLHAQGTFVLDGTCSLVIEAEDFHEEIPASAYGTAAEWKFSAHPKLPTGSFTGTGAMSVLPELHGPWRTDFSQTAPELRFDTLIDAWITSLTACP